MIQIPNTPPAESLASAALEAASSSGATVAQFRLAKHDMRGVSMRDGDVENIGSESSVALSVRVVHSGAWGFAATTELTVQGAVDTAMRAIALAKISSKVAADEVVLANSTAILTSSKESSCCLVKLFKITPFKSVIIVEINRLLPKSVPRCATTI